MSTEPDKPDEEEDELSLDLSNFLGENGILDIEDTPDPLRIEGSYVSHGDHFNQYTRHTAERQMQELPQHIPDILHQYDLAAFDIIQVYKAKASERFCGLFLSAVRAAYLESGIGVYECVLEFYRNNADDGMVNSFAHSARQFLSRVRKAAPQTPPFRFVFMRYEILPDRKHVACSFARMSPSIYNEWLRNRQRETYAKRSTITLLKDML